MELALKQLEKYIGGMTEGDRAGAVRCLNDLLAILGRYKLNLTGGALLQVLSSAGVAHAAGTMDRWMVRLRATAQRTGPYVGAVFSADAQG
jgi:hypothetical protein